MWIHITKFTVPKTWKGSNPSNRKLGNSSATGFSVDSTDQTCWGHHPPLWGIRATLGGPAQPPSCLSRRMWSAQRSSDTSEHLDGTSSLYLGMWTELYSNESASKVDIWMSRVCWWCLHSHTEQRPRSELHTNPKSISAGLADTRVGDLSPLQPPSAVLGFCGLLPASQLCWRCFHAGISAWSWQPWVAPELSHPAQPGADGEALQSRAWLSQCRSRKWQPCPLLWQSLRNEGREPGCLSKGGTYSLLPGSW